MRSRPLALAFVLALSLPAVAPAADDTRCTPAATFAVDGFRDPADDLARVGELVGAVAPEPRLIRRGGFRLEETCAAVALPWNVAPAPADGERFLTALPARLEGTFNSRFPEGANDGLLWAGRGVSAFATVGVAGRYGPLSFALAPEVAVSQNRDFTLVPNGKTGDLRFQNAWYGDTIDYPQRFGAGTPTFWAPGQSYLRLDVWNVAAGVSTENLWFGPGIRNSIVMSSAAAGFPHAFVGTSRPADIWIGTVEAKVLWGRLDRTRYVTTPTHPLLTALVVDYTPRWLPRLSLGLARVQLQVWDDLRVRDWFPFFQSFEKKNLSSWYGGPQGDNPRDNQLASAFGRWAFPESGLEIYLEWAREDHENSWAGFIREPDHTQAYTLGLQKVARLGERWVRFHAEYTDLQEFRPVTSSRGQPVYYIHGNDLSYTYQGQLLGAWIGPGADSQLVALDVFGKRGRIGGYLERVRRNEPVFWLVIDPNNPGEISHDTEVTAAVRQVFFAGPVDVSWEAAATYRWDRDFLRNEPNLRLGVQLAMPLGRRP
ncbi:capsule assembly Wzi family protein [Anaeromyxobacter soli]|uniref:capsule assembly Wzi family protein n=1 Tax=Anaeromyxobacter soli TaxID=2922725 RepID=UPI001FB02FFD|nr:capsule assembly Wzi family protein [Anaeromyxobacter sp. SG29]